MSIADFDEEQVKTFIDKWFESHNQPELGKQCWQKLSSGNQKGTKELTKTPLLLAFICILFKNRRQIPQHRSTLYSQIFRSLLDEWDTSKDDSITRSMIYQGLNIRRKQLMLAQIAYENFVEDDLFFLELEVSQQIKEALEKILPEEQYIDGRKVLREIEAQHGIMIERFPGTYSFSHLTLQEYLTALHIYENEINIKELMNNHFFDQRWREVFLILAGLKKADNLLLTMEKSIHNLINTPNLKNLLLWVEKVTDQTSGDIQPVGKRAISLAYAYAYANAYANPSDALAKIYGDVKANALAYAYANVEADAALHQAYAIAYAYANIKANAYANEEEIINEFIDYALWSNKYQIYQGIDFDKIIDNLEKCKSEIPERKVSRDIYHVFAQNLIDFWLKFFYLTPEMVSLSNKEIEALYKYFYGNCLMLECKNAAVKYSPQVWQDIESRMLLPQ